VQDMRVRERPGDAGRRGMPAVLGPDSLLWLLLVSVLFFLAEIVPALLRLPLGADEITYIARSSLPTSGVFLPPVHGHGAGLLAAPVTMLTSSLTALRVWMSLLSAAGLFFSLLCWRGLRSAWVLAVAGFIFGSLAVTQISGVQVYPDLWAGFGSVAITGLLLQAVQRRARPAVVLPGIVFSAFVIVMMRPQNIVFILAPTFLAPIVVRGWRQPGVLVAMIVGMALGVIEWVGEAYLWFDGLSTRIHLADQEPPTFGLHFSLFTQMKTLSGPWYTDTTTGKVPQFSYPAAYLWWLPFMGLVALGVWLMWHRSEKASSLLAVVTGLWVAVLYVFLVPFGAPRYFLPTWGLFAIIAADAIAWMVTVPQWKKIGVAIAAVFLVAGAASQHIVLNGLISSSASSRNFQAEAAVLKARGLQQPCMIYSPSVAYYAGCTAPWTVDNAKLASTEHWILDNSPAGSSGWREVRLPGLTRANCEGLQKRRGLPGCWYWTK
jgi:hypothetical protein